MATTQPTHDPTLERPSIPSQDGQSSSNPPPPPGAGAINRGIQLSMTANEQVMALLKNVPGLFPSVSAFLFDLLNRSIGTFVCAFPARSTMSSLHVMPDAVTFVYP